MSAFWLALQFLTRLPTPQLAQVQPATLGRSVLFYPLIGLIIGAALYALSYLDVSAQLMAAMVLVLWVYLSGALHIDGLADMADAWVGGHGDRERTLEIMKDPASGPMGVSVVVALLLLKYAALVELLQYETLFLLLVPVLGRSFAVLLMLTTPYVREQGLASEMVRHLPRLSAWSILGLLTALLLGCLQWQGMWVLMATIMLYWVYRRALIQRLAGFTGDAAGALIEIVEVTTLLVLAIVT